MDEVSGRLVAPNNNVGCPTEGVQYQHTLRATWGVGKRFPLSDPLLRVLCIGDNATQVGTRCAVLNICGFEAESATVTEAARAAHRRKYDLIILPTTLNVQDQLAVLAKMPGTIKILQADYFAGPDDLLAKVRSVVGQPSDAVAQTDEPAV